MGEVEKRDDDTAVVIPTSDGRRKGRDPDPVRRRELSYREPIPDDEWIRGEVEKDGFTLKTPDPSPDEETGEWIRAGETINARDMR